MEILDLYDEDGKPLGKTIQKGEKFDVGNIMLSIIFIENSNNEYLIQHTSIAKGSKYSSTGGHVSSGEDGITTIVREVKEELGLSINAEEITFVGLVKHPDRPCLINLFKLNKDIDVETLVLQKDEVEEVMWMKKDEILNLINNELFLASHGFLFKNYIMNMD